MSTVELTLNGLVLYATVGVWRSGDVSRGRAQNPLLMVKTPTHIYTHKINGYVGDVLIRVRHRFYFPFEVTATLQEPKTDISVIMTPDGLIDRKIPALPEFTVALIDWLKEQNYEVSYDDNLIYILETNKVVVLECYLYIVKCPDMIIEWCEPEMFPKIQLAIEKKLASLPSGAINA